MQQSQRRWSTLVVEANRPNRMILGQTLANLGHAVTMVDNGEAALERLLTGEHDLALVNLDLPLDGIETIKFYRFCELGQERIPIVALSTEATPGVGELCQQAGIDACLTLPVGESQLQAVLDRLLPDEPNWYLAPSILASIPVARVVGTESLPAFEADVLNELNKLGGSGFVESLVEVFFEDVIESLRALSSAVHNGDLNSFRKRACNLRAGAAALGARGIAELCADWGDVSNVVLYRDGEHYLRELEREFDRLRGAILLKRQQ